MWWAWLWLTFAWAEPVVTPGGVGAVELSSDTEAVAADALETLRSGRFIDAARQLGALADAGGSAELRFLEAVALYEAGQPRGALTAVVASLAGDPVRGDALALHGLLLADLGRGDEGLEVLARAVEQATTPVIEARALLFRATIHADRGEDAAEARALTKAEALARSSGDAVLIAEVTAQRQAAAAHAPADLVGSVSEQLRRGARAEARRLAESAVPHSLRDRLRRALALAAVARAEGALDVAYASLTTVVDQAQGAGLLRELVAAQVELARTAALAGRLEEADAVLRAARQAVGSTSLRVRAFDVWMASGRLAARRDDERGARTALGEARALAASLEHPDIPAQVAELQGEVAALTGDAQAADAAWARAAAHWTATGRGVDAARVHTARVRSAAAASLALPRRIDEATAAFAAVGDALGPAHVAIAEGLGHARARSLEPALAAFARAAETAGALPGARAARVRDVAEANAAEALTVLGHTASIDVDGEDLVARHTAFEAARASYARGRAAFDARRFEEAVAAFGTALEGADRLGEVALAQQARHAHAWAVWNAAIAQPDAEALPRFERVVEAASLVGDRELLLRAEVSAATAGARLGRPGAAGRLDRVADRAEAAGLADLAARCLVERAELGGELHARAQAAVRAVALRDQSASWYAAYSVGFDAVQAGRADVAKRVLEAVEGRSWDLSEAVSDLLAAVRVETSQ